jgi:pyruvate formate lyase activating enzyme
VNDNKDNFGKVAQLLKDAKGLERLELLPYPQTAGAKYGMLGKEYRPPFDTRRPIYLEQKVFQQNDIHSIIL